MPWWIVLLLAWFLSALGLAWAMGVSFKAQREEHDSRELNYRWRFEIADERELTPEQEWEMWWRSPSEWTGVNARVRVS